MTRDEAQAVVAARKQERPEDGWAARERDGEWEVVRLAGMGRRATSETVEAKPKPPQADDPRPAFWRDVGGPYAGG